MRQAYITNALGRVTRQEYAVNGNLDQSARLAAPIGKLGGTEFVFVLCK